MRFSEFDDFWLPTTLSSICSFRKKRKSSIKKFYVSTENILQNYKGIEQYNSNEVISGVEFLTGDILMANIRPYLKKVYMAEFDGVSNSDVLIFKSDMVDSNFLHCILANDNFINYVMNSVKGSKMPRGDKIHIMNYHLSIPKAKEQEKIAKFIDLIDLRIDTQSKIIEDLELFKNMISYKILYDDKTACYKPLSSFSELKNGYAFKSTTYSSIGNYQIVTIANVSGERYIDLTSTNKILNIPNDIQSHQILKINDILISLTGNVGRVSYCNKLNCLLNQRVGLLSIKNKDLIEYIFQSIHNKIFEKTMISRGQGVAQLNIGKNDVESFEIPVYNQDKMNSISEVLKSIDFKIIKEKDILELYKKQKAYLLKNMFI